MRRMFSEKQIAEIVKNNPQAVVKALEGQDISVEGITSKGIANTGGLANIGDVAISGDLIVQGEGKGVITCKEVKEEYDTELIDLSEKVNTLALKSNSLYAKVEVKHGLFILVVSGNAVSAGISGNALLLKNFASLLPDTIKSKIFRANGIPISEYPENSEYKVALTPFTKSVGSTISSSSAGLRSESQNHLTLTCYSLGTIAEDTELFIDVRFMLTI